MSREPSPDQNFLARQLCQVISDLGSFRDDINVMTAISLRMEHTLSAFLTEVRAMNSQHND